MDRKLLVILAVFAALILLAGCSKFAGNANGGSQDPLVKADNALQASGASLNDAEGIQDVPIADFGGVG